MNKKAMLDDLGDLIFTIVFGAAFLFFLGFAFSSNIQVHKEKSLVLVDYSMQKQLLVDYLNLPFDDGLTVMDAIILAKDNDDMQDALIPVTEEHIRNVDHHMFFWVVVKYNQANTNKISIHAPSDYAENKLQVSHPPGADFTFPSLDPDLTISVHGRGLQTQLK